MDLIERQAALNIRFSDAINEDGVLYVPLRDFTDGLKALPSAEPNPFCALADRVCPFQGKEFVWCLTCPHISEEDRELVKKAVEGSQPKTVRLTDDDFEAIRIHLNAQKERLCNQQRWEEADEYQRIIDRFTAFASAVPKTGRWIEMVDADPMTGEPYVCGVYCSECGERIGCESNFCPNCGADMRGEQDD